MFTIRKSNERGSADHGWLKSMHTFSFASYYDAKHMGFSVLRVINEDFIQGGTGFGMHPHRDMEIITYMVDGALEHQDSMGNTAVINAGEVQRMSAGTGVKHSEYNHLENKNTHLLQIWILPEQKRIEPSYEQKSFTEDFKCNDFVLVVSKNGRNSSISINQDIDMYVTKAQNDGEKTFKHRNLWLQVIKGDVYINNLDDNNIELSSGDAVAISDVEAIKIKWNSGSEFILFDLP
ncbi:MAG: hypothetical protein RLZZ210_39 [Pseudomonadota bacterium]|jgi:redox-sensitive bicupin YhaK (pirin superfamily)